HLHTNFSDSSLSCAELVKLSVEAGLSAIAVTDHDCIEGIDPAQKEAEQFGLEVIPGVELTAEIDSKEVHILGYYINHHDKILIKKLEKMKKVREKRIFDMVKKLKTLGVDNIDPEEVLSLSGMGTVGRAHLAVILKRKGWVNSFSQAFQKYIGDNSPAYVSKFRMSPEEAINTVLDAGGIPVLAHPHSPGTDDLIPELVSAGLKGLEVYYPGYSQSQIQHYKNLADKLDLLVTGGSDYHGDIKDDTIIGRPQVSYEVVEKLKQAKNEKR
ncbi:MAG: PHP domain-containing protein, partial [Candidatus Omnitrophica bacterium]|nr:PHP domain-containing protein [Candidatus Omnitrophota bacterium]